MLFSQEVAYVSFSCHPAIWRSCNEPMQKKITHVSIKNILLHHFKFLHQTRMSKTEMDAVTQADHDGNECHSLFSLLSITCLRCAFEKITANE